ncbi:hypothetical protein LRC484719_48700 [Mycobacterium riyadhense]|uniref:PE family protein n=1 Tax=Mycobacterium riyadhense TaxID=486698 RepID=A0A653ECT7_9MYCO|nr:PE family protein [Mycobacterium riyadhense]MCV7145779.1 PE family protein [Mycobacterium riyadhense]VTO95112.1 PE family protein [Mycobacterium riyadhense]
MTPYVTVVPQLLAVAASDLAGIGSTISAANAVAAAQTTRMAAAAADEVSAALAALFETYAQHYQTIGAQVATFHDQFVNALTAASGSYAATEAVNVGHSLLTAVNAQTMALLGRPLIGDGADATVPGGNGAPGGLLYGNGGAGAAGESGVAGGQASVNLQAWFGSTWPVWPARTP